MTEQFDNVTKSQQSQRPYWVLGPSQEQSDDNDDSFEMAERDPPNKLTNPLKPILQGNSRLRPLHLKWIIGLLIGLAVVSCVVYIASSKSTGFF